MIIYILSFLLVSLLLGYFLAFGKATLTIGRSISTTGSSTGFQDAITPPWSSSLAIVSYLASLGIIGYGWYEFGWLTGFGITVCFIFVVALNIAVILPKSEGEHFRQLIVQSMISRYADYVKSGDQMRAAAMAGLLGKMGLPVPTLADLAK